MLIWIPGIARVTRTSSDRALDLHWMSVVAVSFSVFVPIVPWTLPWIAVVILPIAMAGPQPTLC